MKFYCNLFYVFILSFLFIACEKDVKPSLSISPSETQIANASDTIEIEVNCNTNWSATASENWCSISPRSGDGNGTIKVVVTGNYSVDSRKASIEVYCQGLKQEAVINQSNSQLATDQSSISFEKYVSSKTLVITTNTKWSLEIPSNGRWVSANITSGYGNANVVLTAQSNAGAQRSTNLIIKYSSSKKYIEIVQKRAQNIPPSIPEISYPGDKATNVQTIPGFKWNASVDPENDEINYTVYYSKDKLTWSQLTTSETQAYLNAHLNENTTYYWKIKATDSYGDYVFSDVYSFTTGIKVGLADGEYTISQNSTAGKNGAAAEILFLGDGYTAADFQQGGLFDQNVKEGIDAFFSIEPYKTYQKYFRVYKLASYSSESGVSQADRSITKKTALSSSFNGGSAISANTDVILNYAKSITGADEARLRKMLIIVMVNQDRYAGTTYIWADGTSIALCPVSRSAETNSKYKNVINHEAGGHGFGKLADEYINYQNKEITTDAKTEAQNFVSEGFFANIDFTSDVNYVKWKNFFSLPGYERVGVYQGAYYFALGVWRPETSSCMIYNEPYYNAPSRQAIVKRIMENSGYTFYFSDFLDLDLQKTPSAAVQAYTKSVNPLTFVPLARPVIMKSR